MMSIIFASPSNCDAFYEYPAARLAVHSPYSPSLPAPQTWPSGVAWPARWPPLPLYYSCFRRRRRAGQAGLLGLHAGRRCRCTTHVSASAAAVELRRRKQVYK